jgi:hypothetical protein
MYTIKIKRYKLLSGQSKIEIRLYWYKKFQVCLGSFYKNQLFVNYTKVLNFIPKTVNFAKLTVSRNIHKFGLSSILSDGVWRALQKKDYVLRHNFIRANKKYFLRNFIKFCVKRSNTFRFAKQFQILFAKRWQ